jgi:hypothetical protein
MAGVHAGLWLTTPPAVIALVSLEAVLVTMVIITALFASPHFSDRAYRMLPWTSPDRSPRADHVNQWEYHGSPQIPKSICRPGVKAKDAELEDG